MNLSVVLYRRRRLERGTNIDGDKKEGIKITTRIISYSCKRVLFYYILTRPHYARGLFELITQRRLLGRVYTKGFLFFFPLSPAFFHFHFHFLFFLIPRVQSPTKMQIEMSHLTHP